MTRVDRWTSFLSPQRSQYFAWTLVCEYGASAFRPLKSMSRGRLNGASRRAPLPLHSDISTKEAWRGLGESRIALHDPRGAIGAFETLVSLTPQDPVALMQLGESYRDLSRWDDATRTIQRALSIDPGPAQYWNSLGTVLGSSGKMPEAEHAFGEAVKRDPANGLYHYNHGLALQQLGRRDDAITEFRQAQALGYRAP